LRSMVPPAYGACTHARRRYSVGLSTSGAIFERKNALVALCRQGTTDVQEYLHHGPQAACYSRIVPRPIRLFGVPQSRRLGFRAF
jgi:hypothetical protein